METLILKLIDKYPEFAILYIIFLGLGTGVGLQYYKSRKVHNKVDNHDMIIMEIKSKLEEISKTLDRLDTNSSYSSQELSEIKLKIEILLERLRGKEL